jgi:hypothetical protein
MQFDSAVSWGIVVAGNASTNTVNGVTMPEEHSDRWIDATNTDSVLRVNQTYRCFDDPPVLHRRDESSSFVLSDSSTLTISPSNILVLPKGTVCTAGSDSVVCVPPENQKP